MKSIVISLTMCVRVQGDWSEIVALKSLSAVLLIMTDSIVFFANSFQITIWVLILYYEIWSKGNVVEIIYSGNAP